MLIAWLKLRQRSLGPILDASGWAINGRMNINLGLGRSLSQTAKVPANAKRNYADPYADSHGLRNSLCVLALVAAAALLAWRMHWLDAVLPVSWQHVPAAPARQRSPHRQRPQQSPLSGKPEARAVCRGWRKAHRFAAPPNTACMGAVLGLEPESVLECVLYHRSILDVHAFKGFGLLMTGASHGTCHPFRA
jgi:hypothetical protein